jgi:hypothetical protein
MRKYFILSICIIFCTNALYTQTWYSSPRDSSFKVIFPSQQFSVNPYTNALWFVGYTKTTCINPDGSVLEYGTDELGYLTVENRIKFAFIQNKTFFAKDFYGLYELTGSTPNLIYASENFEQITTNEDTLYLTIPFQFYLKIFNNEFISSNHTGRRIIAKHNFLYRSLSENGSLVKQTGANSSDYVYYSQTDDEYICSQYNDIKFSRLTDTLYVGCKKGISFAYNYDFLDTITPNNTNNMPSANVLEMEFDLQDRMWAVFGDANDMPFAIAMLENGTWVNYFDATNSPIQFISGTGQKSFRGLEIDTLGNVWVCDNNNLHTLLNENTPAWIGLIEIEQNALKIYPNPTKEYLQLDFDKLEGNKQLSLIDLQGKIVMQFETEKDNYYLSTSNLKKGVYFLNCKQQNVNYHYKIVKE